MKNLSNLLLLLLDAINHNIYFLPLSNENAQLKGEHETQKTPTPLQAWRN